MPQLDQLLHTRPDFDLDELAEAANALLPDLLPDDPVDARVKAAVNPRLIRHYVSEELIDPSLRVGRRAKYTVDHLLQLLALRRLLADGVPSTTIGTALRSRSRNELRAIAEGRADAFAASAPAEAAPADPRERARAALAAIRARSGVEEAAAPAEAPLPSALNMEAEPLRSPPPAAGLDAAESWERVPLLDGVELHVRSDVRLPRSPEARSRLLDHVIREIVRYAQGRDR